MLSRAQPSCSFRSSRSSLSSRASHGSPSRRCAWTSVCAALALIGCDVTLDERCVEPRSLCSDDGTALRDCKGGALLPGNACAHGCIDDDEVEDSYCADCDGGLMIDESVCSADELSRVVCTPAGLVVEACAACCFEEGGDAIEASCEIAPGMC